VSRSLPVPAGPREVRVERSEEGEVHRPHDSRVLERGAHGQDHRPRHLQVGQVRTRSLYELTLTPFIEVLIVPASELHQGKGQN